jgi:hypothetical protein
MRRATIILLAFVFLLFFGGKPPQKESVQYSILESGDTAALDYREPTLVIMSNAKELGIFYRRLHSTKVPRPDTPMVDFSTRRVVFVSYGRQTTAGYAIELLDVYIKGNVLVLEALFSTPLKDSMQAQVITHPYLLLSVSRAGYTRVELRNPKGEMLAFKSL